MTLIVLVVLYVLEQVSHLSLYDSYCHFRCPHREQVSHFSCMTLIVLCFITVNRCMSHLPLYDSHCYFLRPHNRRALSLTTV